MLNLWREGWFSDVRVNELKRPITKGDGPGLGAGDGSTCSFWSSTSLVVFSCVVGRRGSEVEL